MEKRCFKTIACQYFWAEFEGFLADYILAKIGVGGAWAVYLLHDFSGLSCPDRSGGGRYVLAALLVRVEGLVAWQRIWLEVTALVHHTQDYRICVFQFIQDSVGVHADFAYRFLPDFRNNAPEVWETGQYLGFIGNVLNHACGVPG
jgi:hypothetical protein